MKIKTPGLLTGGLLAALALPLQQAQAHPGYIDGGSARLGAYNVTPTGETITFATAGRGYAVDAIRISHGCTDEAGAYTQPVTANSWVWPMGLGERRSGRRVIDDGMAPMTTCDVKNDKNECIGAGKQPSVARIPNSGKNASDPLGQGTATTLVNELVEPQIIECKTVGHSTTCTWAPSTTPVTNLSGRMTYLGNIPYFAVNQPKTKGGGGFWSRGGKWTYDEIVAAGVTSAGAPTGNAVQIRNSYKPGFSTGPGDYIPIAFGANSCARKLVVRAAGADICHLSPSLAASNGEHAANYWFGGPTKKFGTNPHAHGSHENFWMGYTLVIRDTVNNPYPESCVDKVNGDYDLVVMPTIKEIDDYLAFPGFATQP